MIKHGIVLTGGTHGELRVSASVLHETIGALLDGARRATRFAVEGQSVRHGPRPAWLDAACAIDITGLSEGSANVALDAPTLQEADADKFGDGRQQSFFEEQDLGLGKQTAIDLFGKVLAAAIEGSVDNLSADRALLDSCVRFARVAGGAFNGVQLHGLQGRAKPLTVTAEHAPKIEVLRDETPQPVAVRLSGTLDTISASRADIILTLKDETKVPARLEDHDSAMLQQLFGSDVVVSGVAHFRPSGRLFLLDIESLDTARENDQLFESLPTARQRLPVAVPVEQDDTSGVSAFFGTWPGDETEEDLLEALKAIG